jgi:DNA primase
VLLLPDGDDPDSFARKHTAQQFKEYIEAHQTDFIQFKTDLLLKGVSDPVKRAEVINNIVLSVSVIPDPVVRAAYIADCSNRLGVNERTLITQTNKFIAERRTGTSPSAATQGGAGLGDGRQAEGQPAGTVASPDLRRSATPHAEAIERMLIQTVIRHGEEIIISDVEDEDGAIISMNVAQYIAYDLGNDDISFSNELYNRVLDEAVSHSADPGFKAEQYFMQHPDPQISQLALTLGVDNHQLSRLFEKRESREDLLRSVEHLVMDYRLGIVNSHLKDIQRQLKEEGRNMSQHKDRVMELMQQYKQINELRNELAKRLGAEVLVQG